ncbi:hypothetical protein CPB86DRAFT_802872 [Serendipita vermifera]|nr:hypothetical protein CPB86DRAFT_802872 [Serendipita vermifera]
MQLIHRIKGALTATTQSSGAEGGPLIDTTNGATGRSRYMQNNRNPQLRANPQDLNDYLVIPGKLVSRLNWSVISIDPRPLMETRGWREDLALTQVLCIIEDSWPAIEVQLVRSLKSVWKKVQYVNWLSDLKRAREVDVQEHAAGRGGGQVREPLWHINVWTCNPIEL